jgi:hypothetical protein
MKETGLPLNLRKNCSSLLCAVSDLRRSPRQRPCALACPSGAGGRLLRLFRYVGPQARTGAYAPPYQMTSRFARVHVVLKSPDACRLVLQR